MKGLSLKRVLLLIAAVWAISVLYPSLRLQPLMSFETWEARKLLDYGFFNRHGAAILGPDIDTGILPNPEAFNRNHHPYPIMWLYALLYFVFGNAGVVVLGLAVRLAACLLVFLVLDRVFDRLSAFWATILFTLAPISMHLRTEIVNATTLCSILWPAGAWALTQRSGEESGRKRFIGLFVCLAILTDWFSLIMIPSLLILAEGGARLRNLNPLRWFRNPVARSVLIGTAAGVLLFVVQIIVYEPDFLGLFHHLRNRSGTAGAAFDSGSSRTMMILALIPVRCLLFVGFPLLAGSVAGLFFCRKVENPLIRASLFYFLPYAFIVFALPAYFVNESSLYSSLLFPAAVLTACAIQFHRVWLRWILLAFCAPGIVEVYLYASVLPASGTSVAVGEFIAAHSAKTDVVLTNLKSGASPYKKSDAEGGQATPRIADRLIFFDCRTPKDIENTWGSIKRTNPPVIFVLDEACPIDPELVKQLEQGERTTESIRLPQIEAGPVEKIRNFFFYKIMRKSPLTSTNDLPRESEPFQIYKLKQDSFYVRAAPTHDSHALP